MTNTILNYEKWVIAEALAAAPTPASGAIAICSAFSSESNVLAALAKELAGGFDLTKKYTFRFRSFDDVSNIAASIRTAKVEPITDMTQNDVLIVNNKSIIEKGSITLTKAEAPGELIITASNNGILTLVRLGNCFKAMVEQGVPNILGCKNWAIKLEIGNPVVDPLARGFNFWVAAPGGVQGTANSIGIAILMLAVKSVGMPDTWLRLTAPDVKTYYDAYAKPYMQSKDYQSALNLLATNMGTTLKQNNALVADNPQVNVVNFNTLIRTIAPKFQNLRDATVPPRIINFDYAYPALKLVMADVATAIAIGGPGSSPEEKAKAICLKLGLPESATPVVQEYFTLLKSLLSRGNPIFAQEYIQVQSTYAPGGSGKSVAQQSTATQAYGEGQYGK
jgi:hypothetical protein